MIHNADRAYDSFIVRLWRGSASERWARAEIEHVQSGVVARERGVPLDKLLARLRALIDGEVPHGDGPATDQVTEGGSG